MVSVGEIIGEGFRLVRDRIASVAIWAVLYLALHVAVLQAMSPFLRQVMSMQATQAAGTPPDPSAMLGWMGGIMGVSLLMLVGMLVLFAAALRSALRPADSAFAYLRLGMDELRMLAVAILLTIAFFIFYIAIILVSSVVGAAIGMMAHGAIVPVVILLMLATFAAFVFLQVRFSLVFALTMLRRKIVVGESWALSRGRFWMLFGAYFIVFLIVFVGAIALFGVTQGSYFAELGRSAGNPEALRAAQQQQLARQFGPVTLSSLLFAIPSAAFGTFWITLGAGVVGAATTGLLQDAFGDIGAVYE